MHCVILMSTTVSLLQPKLICTYVPRYLEHQSFAVLVLFHAFNNQTCGHTLHQSYNKSCFSIGVFCIAMLYIQGLKKIWNFQLE